MSPFFSTFDVIILIKIRYNSKPINIKPMDNQNTNSEIKLLSRTSVQALITSVHYLEEMLGIELPIPKYKHTSKFFREYERV